jgi:NADPH-dependent 2,4-dienoyl-CoA reductase/sulfur reductase-like enzyme
MMKSYNYIIIGGGLAGGRTADGIRKVDPSGSILLITDEPFLPYQRPPLSKGYLTGKVGLDHVYLRADAHYSKNAIEICESVRVDQIDPAARSISLEDGRELGYEKLMLATGARARKLPLPGHDLPHVYTLRTIGEANAIQEAARSGQRALVVGGSFTGSEVTASLTQIGMQVTQVFPESRILERIVPEEMSAFLQDKYRAQGVQTIAATRVERLEGQDCVERAILDNGEVRKIDLVVMGVGVELNTDLADPAGLELDDQGAVLVDEYLRTSDPRIYAAGDIASWPDPTFGKRLRVEHWNVARGQGLRAGRNMAGQERPYTTLPYFFSDLFDTSFEVWGDLEIWDQTVLRGSLEQGSYAFYYFHKNQMVGVLAVGRPEGERKPMQQLVKLRPTFAEVAGRLRDGTVALDTLIK